MGKRKLLHINCAEAGRLSDKAQYREASLLEKLRLRMHYLICKACKKYEADNSQLSRLIKKAGIQTCTNEEREHFREQLKAESSEMLKKP